MAKAKARFKLVLRLYSNYVAEAKARFKMVLRLYSRYVAKEEG